MNLILKLVSILIDLSIKTWKCLYLEVYYINTNKTIIEIHPLLNCGYILFYTESLPASGVVISGNPVNKTITFLAQGIMMAFITLNITNDEIVRENVEIFSLKFEGSSPSDKVILGPNATVRIIDDDGRLLQIIQLNF